MARGGSLEAEWMPLRDSCKLANDSVRKRQESMCKLKASSECSITFLTPMSVSKPLCMQSQLIPTRSPKLKKTNSQFKENI